MSFLKKHFFACMVLLLGLIAVGGILSSYQQAAREGQLQKAALKQGNTPIALLNVTSFDWRDIPRHGIVRQEFILKNPSHSSLQITKLVTSCGCTSAELWIQNQKQEIPAEIPSHASGIIKVSFDPDLHASRGVTKRAVRIETNDPKNPFLIINLIANVQ